eukprot:431298_1
MSQLVTVLFSVFIHMLTVYGASYSINIVSNNITNAAVSKYVFGVNFYQQDSSVNYTMMRSGGEGQTRYNWELGAYNSARDWYFIGGGGHPWKDMFDPAINSGQDILVQIPTMGWVAKSATKMWSFSNTKYGQQQENECTNQPNGCTWCQKDAGNGFWLNGSQVTGNDFNDANMQIYPNNATDWMQAIVSRYGFERAKYYAIDNEPELWSDTHFDVHPQYTTYEETFQSLAIYGSALKKACNYNCKIMGYSPWGWCAYWTDGYDGFTTSECTTGPDRKAHNNLPLTAWYLQQANIFEQTNKYRVLDIFDFHFYPQANNNGVNEGCDESSDDIMVNRLQSPRSLYDWNYKDPSWINQAIAIIPRMQGWINEYYKGTNLSISEYRFGGDTCISSVIAHAEALSIFATYNIEIATRWVAPDVGSLLTNSFNLYTNYDGKRSNIYDKGIYAVWTTTSDIVMVTGYTFIRMDKSMVYVYLFNKDSSDSTVTVSLTNGNFNTKGSVIAYGINDDQNGIRFIGTISNKPSDTSVIVDMPKYSVRFILISQ